MTSIAALEEAELLCTNVFDIGLGMISLSRQPLQGACTSFWNQPDDLK